MNCPNFIRFDRDAEIKKPEWVLPGLRGGQVGLVTAPGGTGKSYLLLEIAMSVAAGKTLIPGLDVAYAGKVGLLNFEDDEFDIQQRGNAILRYFSDIEPAENLFVASMVGETLNLLDSRGEVMHGAVKWLQGQCEGMRLVVLDPLSHIHTADENSASQMSRLVQVLKNVGQATGTAILVAHHTGKNAVLNGQGGLQQSARGSSALVDASRVVITMERPKNSDSYSLLLTWAKINGVAPIRPVALKRLLSGVLVVGEPTGGGMRYAR